MQDIKAMETVNVETASAEIGVSPQTLRSWMKHGLIHIGVADKKENTDKWNYTIWRAHLDRFKKGEVI